MMAATKPADSLPHLDFEKPLCDLEARLGELRHRSDKQGAGLTDDILRLQRKVERMLESTYAKLSPWQKVQVARHPARPHASDYIKRLVEDWTPLAGDRRYGEDAALVGGLGRLGGRAVCLLGHEKGATAATRLKHNFGMPRPEGYRKAIRLMELANRFSLPVVTLIDTPGAYPGVDAEERGQAEAIAAAIETCLSLEVPIVSLVIGEGGSGGAIAIATADYVMMLEHSVYSVISPEGCSSILWRDKESAREAAAAMKMTAEDLRKLGLIDEIIEEPLGGAHRSPKETIKTAGEALGKALEKLLHSDIKSFREHRRDKFLAMGAQFLEKAKQ